MELAEILRRAEAWRAADPDPETVAELSQLLTAKDEKELTDRFSTSLEFGTAGLRGRWGRAPTG
jgi:phosphomannomutase